MEDKLKRVLMEMMILVGQSNDYSPLVGQLYRILTRATGTVTGDEPPDWSILEQWSPSVESFAAFEERMSQPLRDSLSEQKRRIEGE